MSINKIIVIFFIVAFSALSYFNNVFVIPTCLFTAILAGQIFADVYRPDKRAVDEITARLAKLESTINELKFQKAFNK